MKPPISYYGGKQRLASKIIPYIPKHTVYAEPFCGGATVLFKKPWPDVTNNHHYREAINDKHDELINFFRVLRDHGDELARRISLTPYSQKEHALAKEYNGDDLIERARCYYICIMQSFSNTYKAGWRTGTFSNNHPLSFKNREMLQYVDRMKDLYIANEDALKFIKRWDSPHTFFYVDPPYPGAHQGYAEKYTQEQFEELIDTLAKAKGSFILSCYENEAVPKDWKRVEFSAMSTAANGKTRSNKNGARTEVVWMRGNTQPVRPEIQKLYDSGKFDCFTGNLDKKEYNLSAAIERFISKKIKR